MQDEMERHELTEAGVAQDAVGGDDPDQRMLMGIVAAGVLVALVIGAAFLTWLGDEADSGGDELVLFEGADLAIGLEDAFADDGSGGKTAAVDELIEEISGRAGVDRVVYEGPSTITGIAPGAPTLQAFGHRLLVYVDGFAFGVEARLISEYKEHGGVSGIAQAG